MCLRVLYVHILLVWSFIFASVVDRYNLVAVSRPRAFIYLYQQPLNRQEASDVCIEAGGNLAYLDSIIQNMVKDRIESGDWVPNTEYAWIGLHDSKWDSGEAKTFYSGNSKSTGYLAMSMSSYDWSTKDETTAYQFICHKRIRDCVYPSQPKTGISSEIKETDIDKSGCFTLCNSYKYQNDECWGITYDLNQRTCYFHFGSDAKIALDPSKYIDTTGRNMSLYSRICYTFELKNIPTTTQPSTTTEPPTTTQPTTEPPTTQPTTESPTTQKTTEPPTTQPSTEPTTTTQPTTEPLTTQPTTEPPTTQPTAEPSTTQPTTESPTTQPTTESPKTQPETITEPATTTEPETITGPATTTKPATTKEPATITETASETDTTDNVPTSTGSTTVANSTSSNPQQTGNTTIDLGSLPRNVNQTIETVCRCKCLVGPQLEIGSKQLEEKLDEITTELFVNPKAVSAARRKLTSVDDPRPSVKAIGSVLGITTLTVVFGFFICLDFPYILKWFK